MHLWKNILDPGITMPRAYLGSLLGMRYAIPHIPRIRESNGNAPSQISASTEGQTCNRRHAMVEFVGSSDPAFHRHHFVANGFVGH
jgi:hypothetical protein